MPMNIEAISAPASEPEAADDHDDEHDRPDEVRQRRLREPHEPADDARQSRERAADGEHQHEEAGNVMPERAHHLRMGRAPPG